MCLKRNIEHFLSNDSTNDLNDDNTIEWPISINSSKSIIACNTCFYPITLEQFVLKEIDDENNIPFGLIIPIRKLFSRVGICNENCVQQWKTIIFCPNCSILLSFIKADINNVSENDFRKISSYVEHDDQIVILWIYPLYRGSCMEAFSQFRQINEFNENNIDQYLYFQN